MCSMGLIIPLSIQTARILTTQMGLLRKMYTEEFGPDVPAKGYGEYSDWQGVSVANLIDGTDYDITAYTRASLFDGNDFLGDGEVRATDVRFMKAP